MYTHRVYNCIVYITQLTLIIMRVGTSLSVLEEKDRSGHLGIPSRPMFGDSMHNI